VFRGLEVFRTQLEFIQLGRGRHVREDDLGSLRRLVGGTGLRLVAAAGGAIVERVVVGAVGEHDSSC